MAARAKTAPAPRARPETRRRRGDRAKTQKPGAQRQRTVAVDVEHLWPRVVCDFQRFLNRQFLERPNARSRGPARAARPRRPGPRAAGTRRAPRDEQSALSSASPILRPSVETLRRGRNRAAPQKPAFRLRRPYSPNVEHLRAQVLCDFEQNRQWGFFDTIGDASRRARRAAPAAATRRSQFLLRRGGRPQTQRRRLRGPEQFSGAGSPRRPIRSAANKKGSYGRARDSADASFAPVTAKGCVKLLPRAQLEPPRLRGRIFPQIGAGYLAVELIHGKVAPI